MNHRRVVVTTWLLASGVPLVVAAVLIGCCALPFHGLVHRLMPLCDMAEAALTAHHHDSDDGHEQPASPPPQKRDGQDGPRLAWKSETPASALAPLVLGLLAEPPQPIGYRSRVALGAMRCDDDVGTRLALLHTLRI